MTTRDQAEGAAERDRRATDNSAFVRTLLRERQPGFFAALLSAERLVDLELAGTRAAGRVLPDGLRSVLPLSRAAGPMVRVQVLRGIGSG
jgi:hypothetical protein